MCCAVSLVTSHHPHYFFRAVDNTTHVLVPPLSSSLPEKLGRTLPVKGRHRKTVIVHANSNVRRNPNIAKLQAGYLFPEINRIKMKHLEENPDAKIISLGIGDTTEPIPQPITKAMAAAADNLGTSDGYATYGGYGAEQGQALLREKLAERFYADVNIQASDIFVSDGSKCDISRLQMMFGSNRRVAVQDPSYPAYVDSSVMIGNTEMYDHASKQYGKIEYLACSSENDFFPNLGHAKDAELIFFCSPNNPTGAAAA